MRAALIQWIATIGLFAARTAIAQPGDSGSGDAARSTDSAGSGSAGSAAAAGTGAEAGPATPATASPPAVPTQNAATTKPPVGYIDAADMVSAGNDLGFRFGSYGRIIAGTDLRGGEPEELLVGETGPRVVEDSYLELETSYGFVSKTGVKLRPVITLAFDGTLFHENGDFDSHPALRNLFLDATVNDHLTLWVGSRMYRGDDIYLFDFWPLDNQNTVGGGLFWRDGGLELATHFGENRLDNLYQSQTIEVPDPEQGSVTVEQLNRERMVASATASYLFAKPPEQLSVKLKVHGQLQGIVSGTRQNTDGTFQSLPADYGYLVGGEISLFGLAPASLGYRRHLNLFARYAKALAAFDLLEAPTSFGTDLKTTKANELQFGASGNWDAPYGNMMIGAISRRFIDATGETDDNPNNGWEYAIDARPLARIYTDTFFGADISYQARFPDGLNSFTERAEDPAIFQIAPMVVYSPMGPSAYDRPQLRLVFRAAHLNEGARDLYVPDDPRQHHDWVYFAGVQAEWWFNSSTYR